eukprot:5282417-Pleurochrysis_carterae.AAC.2
MTPSKRKKWRQRRKYNLTTVALVEEQMLSAPPNWPFIPSCTLVPLSTFVARCCSYSVGEKT